MFVFKPVRRPTSICMRRAMSLLWGLAICVVIYAGTLLSGCGEKIAIPQPVGDFSNNSYSLFETYSDVGDLRDMTSSLGHLFVLTADSLTKRDWNYETVEGIPLSGATSLCADASGHTIMVWEQSASQLSWFNSTSLTLEGTSSLPEVQRVTGMATSVAGIEEAGGARFFVYLSDPDSGVVHRYAFDEFSGFLPFGILARSDGDAARFVHEAAGIARGLNDNLLVCDVDTTLRNWVIHFDPTPLMDDVTPDPNDQDPWRGQVVLFTDQVCEPAAAGEFVLGNAFMCGDTDWTPGTSTEVKEFNRPLGVATDGIDRIFVADTGNNRIQVFGPDGLYELQFRLKEDLTEPSSMAVLDYLQGEESNYGAYVFAMSLDGHVVQKYISVDEYKRRFPGQPPPND